MTSGSCKWNLFCWQTTFNYNKIVVVAKQYRIKSYKYLKLQRPVTSILLFRTWAFFERCIMVSLKTSGNGRNCTNVNLCESNPCDQICETLYNDYQCSCHTGYTLFNSTHCIDIDECAGDNQCSTTANAVCQNTVGNYT